MSSRVVHVDIHGQRYALRSELDPTYVNELAAYIDEKMRLAANDIQSADSLRVAIVAALNVADELFHSRTADTSIETRVFAKAADIERMIDAVLDQTQDRPVAASG